MSKLFGCEVCDLGARVVPCYKMQCLLYAGDSGLFWVAERSLTKEEIDRYEAGTFEAVTRERRYDELDSLNINYSAIQPGKHRFAESTDCNGNDWRIWWILPE